MGELKRRMYAIDPSYYTPKDAAKALGTTVATIYSLSHRYNINFKKAGWGEYKGRMTEEQVFGKWKRTTSIDFQG